MKYIFFTLFLSILICLGISCKNKHKTNTMFPANGSFCFRPEQNLNSAFIHMEFTNEVVKGHIYKTEKVNGRVVYDFEGEFMNDSTLMLTVIYGLPDKQTGSNGTTEVWTMKLEKDHLWLVGFMGYSQRLEFSAADCGELKNIKEYRSVAQIAEAKNTNEDLTPWLCYESIQSNTDQQLALHEWLQVAMLDDSTFYGRGFGEAEGVEAWEFTYTGMVRDDTVFLARVLYKQRGGKVRSESEKWILDKASRQLRLFGKDGPQDGRQYRQIDCSSMNDYEKKNLARIEVEKY